MCVWGVVEEEKRAKSKRKRRLPVADEQCERSELLPQEGPPHEPHQCQPATPSEPFKYKRGKLLTRLSPKSNAHAPAPRIGIAILDRARARRRLARNAERQQTSREAARNPPDPNSSSAPRVWERVALCAPAFRSGPPQRDRPSIKSLGRIDRIGRFDCLVDGDHHPLHAAKAFR